VSRFKKKVKREKTNSLKVKHIYEQNKSDVHELVFTFQG